METAERVVGLVIAIVGGVGLLLTAASPLLLPWIQSKLKKAEKDTTPPITQGMSIDQKNENEAVEALEAQVQDLIKQRDKQLRDLERERDRQLKEMKQQRDYWQYRASMKAAALNKANTALIKNGLEPFFVEEEMRWPLTE